MKCTISAFTYGFSFAGQKDIGQRRNTNQDEIILCPDIGVFAVSDGMGGLQQGAKASAYVREAIPAMMPFALKDAETPEDPSRFYRNYPYGQRWAVQHGKHGKIYPLWCNLLWRMAVSGQGNLCKSRRQSRLPVAKI